MTLLRFLFALACFAAAVAAPARAAAGPCDAWTLYAGRMSDEDAWLDVVSGPTHVGFTDTYLAVAACARRLPTEFAGLAWEIEGQLGRYFGGQDHWEFNVPLVARVTRFPWRERIATSAAFGLGLSFATVVPPVEFELEGRSHRLLAYWFLELTAGPPTADWALSLRLHHRSGAFGLVADEGGMNALALGVRRRF